MGWEMRSGNRYYYRKRWVNGRPMSEYVGTGMSATWVEALDEIERYERQAAADEWQQVVGAEQRAARALIQVDIMTRALTAAVLIVNGYHAHKHQWRRQR